jgi:uncharacterized protein YggE
MTRNLILVAVLAASAVAAPALAQSADSESRFQATTLDLSATGETHVAPDMATISLGVSHQAATAAEAMAETNADMAKVIAAVKAAGVEARFIQTTGLNLDPQYVYNQNQPPKLTGYQATNNVTVGVMDLTRLGPVADAVVAAGATNIGEISFGLKTRTTAENDARLAAVKALDDKAALYADAAGYHIKRLVSLSEGEPTTLPRQPLPMMRMAAASAPATPVETGQLTVTVTVTGEFELTH